MLPFGARMMKSEERVEKLRIRWSRLKSMRGSGWDCETVIGWAWREGRVSRAWGNVRRPVKSILKYGSLPIPCSTLLPVTLDLFKKKKSIWPPSQVQRGDRVPWLEYSGWCSFPYLPSPFSPTIRITTFFGSGSGYINTADLNPTTNLKIPHNRPTACPQPCTRLHSRQAQPLRVNIST